MHLPVPFNYYRFVLKGDHLHFGLWPDNDPRLPMEDAQQNMFDHLLSFFPKPPATVLDVGCGLGYSASFLARKGYRVTAIAPSPELIEYAESIYGNSGAEFKALGFFDEDESIFTDKNYDVLFFQESAQYLSPLDDVIKRAGQLLKDKGIIIIGDEVCYDRRIKRETSVHLSADFTIALAENGFRITENEKIGKNVLNTCDFIIRGFSDNFDAMVSAFHDQDAGEKLLFYLAGWKKQKQWYSKAQAGYEIFVARKDGFFIRPYAAGDENTILPMFNGIFGVNRSLEHWYWKFRDNPYGAFKVSGAFSDKGDLVAHYAGYPVPFYSSLDKPETFISYQIGDTMTSPAVRNIGLGKTGLLARTANYFYAKFCRENVPFIYGFNTANIKKLGMRYLGYTYIDPVTLWIKDVSKSPFTAPSLPVRLFSGYSTEEIHSVSEEWDIFFARACNSYTFLVKRDANYIRWRYIDCPGKAHRVFVVRKRGRLAGWAVFTKRDKKIIWGDALFDNLQPEAVSYLLHALFKGEFSEAESIEGWFPTHPEWWRNILIKLGFTIAREPNDLTPCFVIFDDPSLLEKLQKYFYYTIGDSDLF